MGSNLLNFYDIYNKKREKLAALALIDGGGLFNMIIIYFVVEAAGDLSSKVRNIFLGSMTDGPYTHHHKGGMPVNPQAKPP